MSELIEHPAARRMREARKEEDALTAPEAQPLQDAIFEALGAHFNYLEGKDLIPEDGELLVAKRHPNGDFGVKDYWKIHDDDEI